MLDVEYVAYHCISPGDFLKKDISDAYAFMYGGWLPQSGYMPDEKPLLEIYPPELHTECHTGLLEYEIALPVIPL